MSQKKQILVLLVLAGFRLDAQDTVRTAKKDVPARRHEVGISILTPLIIMTGAQDLSERYTNLTYRYFLTGHHAIKPFAGISTLNYVPDYPRAISSTNTSTLYFMNTKTTPSNFQVGLGYEYIMGHKKLKHVIGADLYYNNKFVKEKYSYYMETDSTDQQGRVTRYTTSIDTGAYVKTNNYNKLGFNLSYSLRYEMSKKFIMTASTTISNKFYRQKTNASYSTDYEMNIIGLIADVSIFYRF